MGLNKKNRLLTEIKKSTNASTQLFLFHHAGGSSGSYFNIAKLFSNHMDVVLIDLPGRRKRLGDSLIDNWQEAVDDILYILLDAIAKPFAFFGHSLGSLIAYHVLSRLEYEYGTLPLCFFPSAIKSPFHISKEGFESSSEDTFFELLYDLIFFGGVPKPFMKDINMVNSIVDLYRHDLKICNSFKNSSNAILSCPIYAIGGMDDTCVNTTSMLE